jgi:hypothetical protein
MGRKVNPLIFRLGSKNKLWDSQYLGKNSEDSTHYFFQDLEFRKYVNLIFKSYDMVVYNCVIKRSNFRLNFFIDFYTSSKISIKALHFFSNISNFRSRVFHAQKFKKPRRAFFYNLISIKNKLKKYIPSSTYLKKTSKYFNKKLFCYSKFKTKIIKTLLHFSNVFELSLHLNNVQNVTIQTLYQNKDINFKLQIQELKTYWRETFFNEMVEILIIIFSAKNAAKLLTSFIIFHFQIVKRHNTFLTFLKRAVNLLNEVKYFKIYGIKITISGKFNGAPRSKQRTIQTGRLPLQNFDSKIHYHNAHAYTPYGTFGVKVWVCEK